MTTVEEKAGPVTENIIVTRYLVFAIEGLYMFRPVGDGPGHCKNNI